MAQRESRFALAIGTPVTTTDGAFGRLHLVVLSPQRWRVVALVLRYGLLPRHSIVVPWEQVAHVTDAGVALRVRCAELAHMLVEDAAPDRNLVASGVDATPLVTPRLGVMIHSAGGRPLAGRTAVLRLGGPVWAIDGRGGRVGALLLTSTGEVRHIVVRRRRALRRDVIVPFGWVRRIDKQGVWVEANRAMLSCQPLYRPDRAIAADVQSVLWHDEVVRALDYADIDVAVRDGVVRLGGYAATPASKARAERAARTVPGALQVVNQIVNDGEVVSAVAQALADHPSLRGQSVSVQARHGVVMLSGAAASAEIRAAAEACAANVPYVRGIINAVQAPGVAITAGDLRVVQPDIGQEVYAPEMQIGRVTQVIIDPPHRRVTAIVVHGQFPDPAPTTRHMWPDELTRHERHVVIPIDAVADVTDNAVLLNISGSEAARYHEFDPARFATPPADWQPLYPYRAADVLIERPVETTYRVSRTASSLRHAGAGGVHDTPSWQQLSRGMPVQFRDHNVGTIEHIWVDSYHGGMGEIVVRLAVAPHSEISVPLDRVHLVEDMGVFADVDFAQLELLPAASHSQGSESVAHAD